MKTRLFVLGIIAASIALATWLAGAQTAGKEITYANQVSRLVQKRCQSCHRDDGVAPFALLSYEQIKGHAKTMRESVLAKRMPPWHADPRYGKFLNDRSLQHDEIDTLVAWIDGGMKKGDDKDLPPPATFPTGWSIGKPDVVITMPNEFSVPAEGVLPYKKFTVDPGFTEDKWIERAEARPGSKTVHHILVYIITPGVPTYDGMGNTTVLCGTAPGDMPTIYKPGLATKIPAGSKLLFEIHYTPNGKPDSDRSCIGLLFAKQPPKHEVKKNILVKLNIRIPPNDPNHGEESWFMFPSDIRALSFMPHMHVRGKSWEYEVIHPDGRKETLLSVPRFDFNWQSIYRFAEPVLIPKGAKLHCVAHWDNSANNRNNPDPNKLVTYGEQTWDEMMNGWIDYVVE